MATFDFTSAKTDIIRLKVDNVVYDIAKDGKVTAGGKAIPKATLETVARNFGEAAKEFASKKVTDTQQIELVRAAIEKAKSTGFSAHFPKDVLLNFDKAAELEAHLARISGSAVATDAELAPIMKLMVEHPGAANVLNAAAHNKLNLDTVKIGEETKRIIDSTKLEGQVTKLRAGIDELVKLHEAGSYDEKAIKSIFLKHPKELAGMVPDDIAAAFQAGKSAEHGKLAVGALDIRNIGATAITEAEGHATTAVTLAKDILAKEATLKSAWVKSGPTKDLEAAVAQLEKLSKDNPESANFIHQALEKNLTEAERTTLKGVKGAGTVLSDVAKGAQAVEKGKDGLKWHSPKDQFTVTQAWKDKKIAAAAGNAEEIAKFEKLELGTMRKMKLGVVIAGALAVTYAAFAAFGKKPEQQKYTTMVGNEPQQGAARA